MKTGKEKEQGCGCTKDLKKEVKEIVEQVEGYSKEDKAKKKKEVEEAFKNKEK